MKDILPEGNDKAGQPMSDEDPGFDIFDLFGVMSHHRDAAALFIVPGSEPSVQMDDAMIPVGALKLSAGQCTALIERILDDGLKTTLQADGRVSFEHTFKGRAFSVECAAKDGYLSASIKPVVQTP
jgi:Tfp pilus assembly ATPase PilU